MDLYFFEEALRITNVWLAGAGLPPLKAAVTQVLVNHEARPAAKREVPAPAAAHQPGVTLHGDVAESQVLASSGSSDRGVAPTLSHAAPDFNAAAQMSVPVRAGGHSSGQNSCCAAAPTFDFANRVIPDFLLKPVEGECAECGHITERRNQSDDDWECKECDAELARQQAEDHRLDDPRHGQADDIN